MGWLSGWSYRKAITVTEQSGNDLENFKFKISLDSSNFDFSKANSDGSDIRFTKDDGISLLSHWIEKWDSSNQEATIWVRIPSISANSSITIYMYYGNSSASDGSSLYDAFSESDDFEGSSNIFTLTSGAIIESTYANTGNYSLHLKKGTGQVEKAYYSFTTPSSGKIHQTLYLLIKGTCNGYIFAYKDEDDSWVGPKISVGKPGETYAFSQSLYYHDGSSYVSIGVSLSYETWYKLEIVIDLDSQTFDFYVDGDKKVENGPFVSSMPTDAQVTYTAENHATGSSSYSHDIYIDTYYKRTLFTDPTYSIGGEEEYTGGGEVCECVEDTFYCSDGLDYTLNASVSLSDDISGIYGYIPGNPEWLSGWNFRRKIVITEQSGEDLYDYQIGIFLSRDNFDFFHAKEDGGDIRFTAEDGRHLLSYWKEKWDYGNKKAIFWVKVPFIPANGSTTIYLYYGNESATDISEDIFDFLDDFEGTSFDTNVWYTDDTYGVGNCLGCYDDEVVVSNSITTIDRTHKGGIYFGCKTFFSRPCIFEMKVRRSNDSKCSLFVEDVNMYGENQGACIDKLGITGSDYYCQANGYVHYFGKDISLAGWAVFTIKYGENGTVFQLDYGEKDETSSSETACNPQDNLTFRFFIEYSKLEIDWVRVRKYTFPEPLVNIKSACGYVDEILDHYDFIDGFYFLEVLQNEVDLSDEINFTYDLYGIIEDTNSHMSFIASWLSWSVNYEGCMGDLEDTISFSDELDYQLPYSTSYLQDTLSYSEALIPHYVLHLSLSDNLYPVLYGIDGLSVSSYTKFEDLFALLDDLLYRKVSTLISEDILSALSDSIEKLKLISSLGDLLSLEDFLSSGVVLILSSNVALTDEVFFLIPGFFMDTLSLYDTLSILLSAKVSSYSSTLSEDIKILFSLKKESSFDLSDHLASSLIAGITFEDFLSLVDALLPLGKTDIRLFFSLIPYPENLFYSLYSTSIKITGIDGILTAEDGIYIFDEERTTGDLMFRFGDMSSSRLKRIDKIFASTPLEKATIHADGSSYSYIGNKWISCGKGLKGKELKVLLENLGDIEFVSFRLVELRRPK